MNINYKKSFLKDIKNIKDHNLRKRLEAVLLEIENADSLSDIGDIVSMTGTTEYFRIRIGDYRLGIKQTQNTIHIIRFMSRGEIYRFFP